MSESYIPFRYWLSFRCAPIPGNLHPCRHIYPPAFRQQMANLWGLPELNHWWLPDNQNHSAVIQSIRSCVEHRVPISPMAAGRARSEDQRNIKSIFANLSVQDDEPSSSTHAGTRRGR